MPNGSIKYLRVVSRLQSMMDATSEFVGAVTDITDQRRVKNRCGRASVSGRVRRDSARREAGHGVLKSVSSIGRRNATAFQGFDPRDGLPRFEDFIRGFILMTNRS